jgi:hypothetical protein
MLRTTNFMVVARGKLRSKTTMADIEYWTVYQVVSEEWNNTGKKREEQKNAQKKLNNLYGLLFFLFEALPSRL